MKNPEERLQDPIEIMNHPFYASVNWEKMLTRQVQPPYKPDVEGPLDLNHFDQK